MRFVAPLSLILLAACAPAALPAATPQPSQPVAAYQTATLTASPPVPTEPAALPSATPSLYTVVAGDTFFTIAARHGISLQALQGANPDVNPSFISPGMQLLVPAASEDGEEGLAMPTPAAVEQSPASCYLSAAGELWCFLLVRNRNEDLLENLSGVVQLLDERGQTLVNVQANPPLNALHPGEAMPLVAYLAEAPAGWHSARGQVSSAFLLTAEEYYLPAHTYEERIEISADGLAAHASGGIKVAAPPSQLWLLAVAYDSRGEVLGFARWEGDPDANPDPATWTFDVWVYSLGGAIARVDLLLEAQP